MDQLCGSPFWDTNLTWYTDRPDFTECFKHTVLIWIPSIYLWILLPLEYYFLKKSKAREIPLNKYNVAKLTFIAFTIMQNLLEAINFGIHEPTRPQVYFYSSLLKFPTSILFLVLTWANIKMGVRSSGILFGYSLLLMICSIPQMRMLGMTDNSEIVNDNVKLSQFLHAKLKVLLPMIIFILNCFADSKPKYWLCRVDENTCPSKDASFLSRLYFFWFHRFVWENYKNPAKDILWEINREEKVEYLSTKFEKYWSNFDEQEAKYMKIHPPMNEKLCEDLNGSKKSIVFKSKSQIRSVLKPLIKMFMIDITISLCLKLIDTFCVLAYPLIFSLFLTFIANSEPAWKGYLCSFLFLFNGCLQAIVLNKMYITVLTTQFKIKSILMSLIYKKALKISSSTRKKYTTGDIMNLLSVDTERITEPMRVLNNCWTTPIHILLSCYFIWNILGFSVLAIFIVIIILLPIIKCLMKNMKKVQRMEMKDKDKRGKFTQELLAGIKVLKLYAWEPYFQQEVFKLRKKEMKSITKYSYLSAFNLFLFACIPFLMSATTFATYVLSNIYHTLDVKKIFVTISYFNTLRNPLRQMPDALSNVTQIYTSLKRVNEFLNQDELEFNTISRNNTGEDALVIENGTFSWTTDTADPPTLTNMNIRIKEGSIVSVVGAVGAGKSSLISVFLGEINALKGRAKIKGEIAYVSQQAWILNTTVKENITLGKLVNESLYEKVLEVCALKHDLEMMPNYDQTEIGEKGINLSGGQKQRISLARALYHEADIYLLDDPFSAVDFHIASQIFHNAIGPNGMLKDKTRLLVTHTTAFLSQMDLIIVLKDGTISRIGTYQFLAANEDEFAKFLQTHTNDFNKPPNKTTGENKKQYSSIHRNNKILQRRNTAEKIPLKNTKKLIEQEHLEIGKIKSNVYKFYLASIGMFFSSAALTSYILYQIFANISNVWLLKWSTVNESLLNSEEKQSNNNYFYFGIYLALGIIEALMLLMGNLLLFSGLLKASKQLHNSLLANTLRWPMWLLDSTPIGRIINRLTADIFILDSYIGSKIVNLFFYFSRLLSICFIIIYTTPICALVIFPILIFLYVMKVLHFSLAHQINRIASINRSPLYSCFVETVSGLSSVRAYRYENQSISRVYERMDRCSSAFITNYVSVRCLGSKMDILAGCIGFFASFFVVGARNDLDIGLIGFSMSYSIQMTREITFLLLRLLDVEKSIVAVERIKEYIEQPQEAPSYLSNDDILTEWPDKGEVVFENYCLRYREDLDLVLKDVSIKVKCGEKIGVVGRTGAGKTSLILGLFRLIEPAKGKILIDGVDITTIGLHLLRSRLTLIPQDPVLFLGTIRFNLDPTGKCSDENLWNVLEKAHLKDFVSNLPGGLQHHIDEGGANISYGQKQLICLARALLRKTKILILDEATASVDVETDELIQKTIRSEFKECTVITIAHRLNTVLDYDRILVMDDGSVNEFDTPKNLISIENSYFHRMVFESGLLTYFVSK